VAFGNPVPLAALVAKDHREPLTLRWPFAQFCPNKTFKPNAGTDPIKWTPSTNYTRVSFMGRPTRPKKTSSYGVQFKINAVALSNQPDVLVQDVAAALDIHPYMLSKWRKEVRYGLLNGEASVDLSKKFISDVAELSKVKRELALLKVEHELLKKWTRFCAAQAKTPASHSSKQSRTGLA
jgi:transposase